VNRQDAEHVRQLPLAGQLGQTDTETGSGALIVRSRRAADMNCQASATILIIPIRRASGSASQCPR
jgi:hypothetical protein